jgi:hypothetical protein
MSTFFNKEFRSLYCWILSEFRELAKRFVAQFRITTHPVYELYPQKRFGRHIGGLEDRFRLPLQLEYEFL